MAQLNIRYYYLLAIFLLQNFLLAYLGENILQNYFCRSLLQQFHNLKDIFAFMIFYKIYYIFVAIFSHLINFFCMVLLYLIVRSFKIFHKCITKLLLNRKLFGFNVYFKPLLFVLVLLLLEYFIYQKHYFMVDPSC